MIKTIENVITEEVKIDKYVVQHKENNPGGIVHQITEGATTMTPLPNGMVKTKRNKGKDDNEGVNLGSDPQETESDLQNFEKNKDFERINIFELEQCVDIRTSCKLSSSGKSSNSRLRAILLNMGLEGGVFYLDKNKDSKKKYTAENFNEIEKDERRIGTWAKKRGLRVKIYSKATEKGLIDFIEGDLIRFEVIYTDRKASSKKRIDDIKETLEIIKKFIYQYECIKGKTITPSTKVLHEIVEGLKRCLEKYI